MMELVTTPDVGHGPGCRDRGLPGGRQDRHRPAGRREVQVLRRQHAVSFAGFAPADKPRFTVYVVVKQAARGRQRRWHRRPRVPQDHDLRPAEVRRGADRDRSPPTIPTRWGRHAARGRSIASSGARGEPDPSELSTPDPARPGRARGPVPSSGRRRAHRPTERTVTGLSLSSQRVRPGDIYAALPGSRAHGATYAADAVAAGAVAVLTDEEGARIVGDTGCRSSSWSTRAPCSAPSPPGCTANRLTR